MPDPDLQTILEDVKTIKSILQSTDAPLPPVWHLLYWVASPALVLIGLLKFFVPTLTPLSFLDTLLWLWVPVFCVLAIVVFFRVSRDIRRTGTRFLAQGRVQAFLYTRLILVPAILTLGYLLSLNSSYSLEGAMLILIAVGMTHLVVLTPQTFRLVPLVYLFSGILELALNLRGPGWTLGNTLFVAAGIAFVGSLLQKGETHHQEAERG